MSTTITMKQHDTRPNIKATISRTPPGLSAVPVSLTEASKVSFIMRMKTKNDVDGYKIRAECSLLNPAGGEVEYEWEAEDTDEVGEFNAEFEVEWSDGGIETFPSDGYLIVNIEDDLG